MPPSKLTLYHYWRSSSSWRVRWAFFLKKISCTFVHIDLLAGENETPEHLKRNPMGYVPVLELTESRRYLAESIAIIEWAEEEFPNPPLLPGNSFERAKIRQLAEVINAGTHPIQNLTVKEYYSQDPEKQKQWSQHWIQKGFYAYDTLVRETSGRFSVGDTLTLADLCLIPQCYNALRNEIKLEAFPTLYKIYLTALETDGYKATAPENYKP